MEVDVSAAWERLSSIGWGAVAMLPNLAIGGAVFILFYLIALGGGRGVARLAAQSGQPDHIVKIFRRLARGALLLFGALIALAIILPSLDAASVFGALGIGSVAVGFAAKDIFQNLLAGILLLVTRPFHIGDQIVSGPHEGTVEDIQIRATLLRTYDNRRVVIPNSELYTNRVVVNTAYEVRRISLVLGLHERVDANRATAVILQALRGIGRVERAPPPDVLFRSLGESSANLELRYWIRPTVMREVLESADEVHRAVVPALMAAGIELPEPSIDVRLNAGPPAPSGGI